MLARSCSTSNLKAKQEEVTNMDVVISSSTKGKQKKSKPKNSFIPPPKDIKNSKVYIGYSLKDSLTETKLIDTCICINIYKHNPRVKYSF